MHLKCVLNTLRIFNCLLSFFIFSIGEYMQLNQVRIVARHFDLTPALYEKIQQKLSSLLKHFSGLIDCMVTLSTKQSRNKTSKHHVEINVHIKNKKICAKSDGANMYAAIESASHKIDKQVLSHKDMIKNHQHTPIKYMDNIKQDNLEIADELSG
jgi:putative sigma-54 modulation protein